MYEGRQHCKLRWISSQMSPSSLVLVAAILQLHGGVIEPQLLEVGTERWHGCLRTHLLPPLTENLAHIFVQIAPRGSDSVPDYLDLVGEVELVSELRPALHHSWTRRYKLYHRFVQLLLHLEQSFARLGLGGVGGREGEF